MNRFNQTASIHQASTSGKGEKNSVGISTYFTEVKVVIPQCRHTLLHVQVLHSYIKKILKVKQVKVLKYAEWPFSE